MILTQLGVAENENVVELIALPLTNQFWYPSFTHRRRTELSLVAEQRPDGPCMPASS